MSGRGGFGAVTSKVNDNARFVYDKQLQFRDIGIYIYSPEDGKLKIYSDGTASDAIAICAPNGGVTIDTSGYSGSIVQNLWETISSDSGSTVASVYNDTLTVAGGDRISTSIAGDTLTIAYTGPLNKLDAIVPPGVGNDSSEGYTEGSFWIDTVGNESYRCVDASIGAAVWIETTLETSELATVAVSGDHVDLLNIGVNTHAQIDTHIASTSNPHSVTIDQVSPLTTQGDLLYHNGAGSVRLAIGASGKILTSNGAGADPSWEDAVSVTYDAVVAASGGDYTTVGAAITAGATSIFVKDGTYLEGNITLPVNCTIVGESRDGAIIDMQTNQLTTANGTTIIGCTIQGKIEGNSVILLSGVNNFFSNYHFILTHTSNPSAASYFVSDKGVLIASNVNLRMENGIWDWNGNNFTNHSFFVSINAANGGIIITGVNATNGGTSDELILLSGANNIISDVTVDFVAAAYGYLINGANTTLDNITGGGVNVQAGGTGCLISNTYCDALGVISGNGTHFINSVFDGAMTVYGTCIIENTDFNSGFSFFSAAGINTVFTNVNFNGSYTDHVGASGKKYVNCLFSAAFANLASNDSFANCTWKGTASFSGDNIAISLPRFDSTLTINAGSDYGIIKGGIMSGDVSSTGDYWRIDGRVGEAGGGITGTFNGDNNVVDWFIDQATVDSGSGNVITEVVI